MDAIVAHTVEATPGPVPQGIPELANLPEAVLSEKDLPMQAIIATSPHADSNASEGDIVNAMALLPRNTVVRIAGNNRTKASLIGLQATVRRSIGLGGWHWLVLPSGEEVKLQRNALTVLEYPTSQEAESSASEGAQLHKPGTPQGYGPSGAVSRLADYNIPSLNIPQGPRVPAKRPRPVTPLAADAGDGRRISLRQQQAAATTAGFEPHVNLGKLRTATLRKYLISYNLPATSASRDDMLDTAQRHFASVEISEEDVVRRFLDAAKRHAAGTVTAHP